MEIDLRMPSDVETGPDTTPPYIVNHECYQVGDNYYLYLFFNEEINTEYINDQNNIVLLLVETIQSISMDTFDQQKSLFLLKMYLQIHFIVNVFEMADLIGNSAENIFYQLNCNFNLNIKEEKNIYKIFPNPNQGTFTVELFELENQISIYSIQGKLILIRRYQWTNEN